MEPHRIPPHRTVPLGTLVRLRLLTTTDGRIVLAGCIMAIAFALATLFSGLAEFPSTRADKLFQGSITGIGIVAALIGTWAFYGGAENFRRSRLLTSLLCLEAAAPFALGYDLLSNRRLLSDTCPALRAYARAPKPERSS